MHFETQLLAGHSDPETADTRKETELGSKRSGGLFCGRETIAFPQFLFFSKQTFSTLVPSEREKKRANERKI